MKRLICLFKGHEPVYAYITDKKNITQGYGVCLICGKRIKAPKLEPTNDPTFNSDTIHSFQV